MVYPIARILNTVPPRFTWQQDVTTPNGKTTVRHEGTLPLSVEAAVCALIEERDRLRSELEAARKAVAPVVAPPTPAPAPTPAAISSRKSRG